MDPFFPHRLRTGLLAVLTVFCATLSQAQEQLMLSGTQPNWTPHACWETPTLPRSIGQVSAYDEDGRPVPQQCIYLFFLTDDAKMQSTVELLRYTNAVRDRYGNYYILTDARGRAELTVDKKLAWAAGSGQQWFTLQFLWPKQAPVTIWNTDALLDAARKEALAAPMLTLQLTDCPPPKKPAKPGTRGK